MSQVAEKDTFMAMTIHQRLYRSFGAILATVLILFIINVLALRREQSAQQAAAQSLDMEAAISAIAPPPAGRFVRGAGQIGRAHV